MEILVGILAFLVAVLAVLQGWSMKKKNPNNLGHKLDIIISQLGKMEQRLNDIWDRVRE